MGNDGGSIPKRRELVKEAARNKTTTELKETQHEQQAHHWSTDPLSGKSLATPVVSDSSGKLYNKDSIIEHLLPGAQTEAQHAEAEKILLGGVRSLKDVVEVRFTTEPSGKAGKDVWICPITRKTLGAGTRAAYLVPCGHAFEASVIKEIDELRCPVCAETYAENDVIPILPTQTTEIARLSLRVKTLKEKGLTHSLKKAAKDKKRKKGAVEATETSTAATTAATDGERNNEEKEDEKVPMLVFVKTAASALAAGSRSAGPSRSGTSTPTPAASGIKNAATASLTAKVLSEQEERNKRRKMQKNENLESLFSSRDKNASLSNSRDFMSRGFTIPAQAKR